MKECMNKVQYSQMSTEFSIVCGYFLPISKSFYVVVKRSLRVDSNLMAHNQSLVILCAFKSTNVLSTIYLLVNFSLQTIDQLWNRCYLCFNLLLAFCKLQLKSHCFPVCHPAISASFGITTTTTTRVVISMPVQWMDLYADINQGSLRPAFESV